MIRLSLLQFRIQAAIALAATAAYALVLAVTGPGLVRMFTADQLGRCHGAGCPEAADYFTGSLTHSLYGVLWPLSEGIILLAPAVIGLFWGAPLVARELETGTCTLAWNQSVTRTRWLAVKLTAGALAAMAVAEALGLMQTWWAAPIDRAVAEGASIGVGQSRFAELNFATHGIAPLGYAAFAFALGLTAGALVRRTIPAMAITLAVFAALQVVMPLWVRPHLAPPVHAVRPVTSLGNALPQQTGPGGTTFTLYAKIIPGQPGAWILSSGPVNTTGHAISTIPAACASIGNTGRAPGANGNSRPAGTGPSAVIDCLASHGVREAISYQPASRYWRFQRTETAIYLALALALAGYCVRRLRRLPC